MIMIAHRGNLNGPKPNLENRPEYIKQALDEGFYAEVDVWVHNGQITLGHDEGIYLCEKEFLTDPHIICHAKNFEAAELLSSRKNIHWFWHEKDNCTITSQGWIWAFPHNVIRGSVLNQPEWNQKFNPEEAVGQFQWYTKTYSFRGVCSDYVKIFRELPPTQ